MWTYAAVKAADAALSPPIADFGQAAATLNAQTQTAPIQYVAIGSITSVLLMSGTGDWDKVQARAVMATTGGAGDQAISLAKRAVFLMTSSQIKNVAAADWPGFSAMMSVLVEVGDISTASQTAITALAQPTVPLWSPPLDAGNIQTARAQ